MPTTGLDSSRPPAAAASLRHKPNLDLARLRANNSRYRCGIGSVILILYSSLFFGTYGVRNESKKWMEVMEVLL